MIYILELMAAIRLPAAMVASIQALIARYGGGIILRNPATATLLKKWAIRILAAGTVVGENIHWVTDAVKSYLSKLFGEVVDSLDLQSILHAGGRAGAKELAKKLKEKYGVDCPIVDLASDTIAEEIGEWFADLLNEQIQLKANTETEVFTTLFPIDNVVPELDAFLCEELSMKLDITVTSVLQNPTLVDDIKTQLIERFMTEFHDAIEEVKLQATAKLKLTFRTSQIGGFRDSVNALESTLPLLTSIIEAGIKAKIPIFNNVNFTPNAKKINNKLRQREYRRTHREVRHWELK